MKMLSVWEPIYIKAVLVCKFADILCTSRQLTLVYVTILENMGEPTEHDLSTIFKRLRGLAPNKVRE